jgi:hypothetical protein
MSKFLKLVDHYRKEILTEADPEAPAPDPAMAPAPPAKELEVPNPEDIIDDLEKSSKKPWVDLAGVLARAMEHKWSDDDIKRINDSMPGGLTIRDFINVRTSPSIRDKYDANIVSASVALFDQVDSVMSENDMSEVVPAEER